MQINPVKTQNFKGYDACQIKNLYMQGVCNREYIRIFEELKQAAQKEGIELSMFKNPGFAKEFDGTYGNMQHPWAQDDKTFVKVNGKTKILTEHTDQLKQSMALTNFSSELGYDKAHNQSFLTGGNTYIGQKPNGEKWILIGEDELKRSILREVSREYGVKMKNIYPISQPDFHIDMAIRPIGYPYILVNDEKMAMENSKKQSNKLALETNQYYDDLYSDDTYKFPYAKCNKTIKRLKTFGFIPIRIGGVYGPDINYMNAIVNKHPDGTISYITNSAKGTEYEGLDKMFERELRAKVPNVRDIYFISGGKSDKYPEINTIMEILSTKGGGIHCLNLEEPSFDEWV